MYKVYLFRQLERVPEQFISLALPILPKERYQKAIHYRQSRDRKNCIIAYLLLKRGLKECFQITDFTLQYETYGKPYLPEYLNVYFNISHCNLGCAVAVADIPIGIDYQDIRPFSWEIASRVCCPQELKILEKSSYKATTFTRIWTRKESYLKMYGHGICCDLTQINTIHNKSIQTVDYGGGILSICMDVPFNLLNYSFNDRT